MTKTFTFDASCFIQITVLGDDEEQARKHAKAALSNMDTAIISSFHVIDHTLSYNPEDSLDLVETDDEEERE